MLQLLASFALPERSYLPRPPCPNGLVAVLTTSIQCSRPLPVTPTIRPTQPVGRREGPAAGLPRVSVSSVLAPTRSAQSEIPHPIMRWSDLDRARLWSPAPG